MQRFEFLRQPLMGELAMSPEEREREREKNAIYSGQLRLCQQPRAAHALRSDQKVCNHISATLLIIGVKNEAEDEALLTKSSCTKADRKKIDNLIGQFDQSEKVCEKVL